MCTQTHHDHHHDHNADHHREAHRPHTEPVVLEIGGELGALVVFTDGAHVHDEIEISPAGEDARRSHKDVLERVVGSRSVFAAVFDRLPGGEYTLWHEGAPLARGVHVLAGAIAEHHWTRERRAA
jgi:hypothetical protein